MIYLNKKAGVFFFLKVKYSQAMEPLLAEEMVRASWLEYVYLIMNVNV